MPRSIYLQKDCVINGLRALVSTDCSRSGRTALMGFLMLKSKEEVSGQEIVVSSQGEDSVEEELKRFFRLAPGTPYPDVNPFGSSQGEIEYLASGYERRGTYTHLYANRNLERVLDVRKMDGVFHVKVPTDAAKNIAKTLKNKIPLEAAATFLLRKEVFDEGADRDALIDRFKAIFHLSDDEINDLFVHDADFEIEFDNETFVDSLSSVPSDLQPPTPSVSHATSARAAKELVPMAQSSDVNIIISAEVRRRIQRACARSKAVALVGQPGTAKSCILEQLLEEAVKTPGVMGLKKPASYVCYTAEVDWSARSIIGGYYPQEDGRLVFKEGYLLQAIRHNQILWIDEMNRADLDRVLGPVLTFLAGQSVDLGLTHLGSENGDDPAKSMVLLWAKGDESGVKEDDEQRVYYVGTDWRLLGTYNNVDRGRVFPLGSALLRRWALVPVSPVGVDVFRELLGDIEISDGIRKLLTSLYELHVDHLPLGPAPYLDMARYVSCGSDMQQEQQDNVADDELLRDAYVLYMGQQLYRVDPEKRKDFLESLSGILGPQLAREAASF